MAYSRRIFISLDFNGRWIHCRLIFAAGKRNTDTAGYCWLGAVVDLAVVEITRARVHSSMIWWASSFHHVTLLVTNLVVVRLFVVCSYPLRFHRNIDVEFLLT